MRKSSLGRYLTSFKSAFRDYVFRALLFLTLAVLAVGFSRDRADQKQINEARQNAHSEREKADDRIADYTWWLTFFTAVLGIGSLIQIAFLINADKTAQLAAESAKRSADAAVAIELPIIRISRIPRLAVPTYGKPFIDNFAIRNIGRTPAIISLVEVGYFLSADQNEEVVYTRSVVPSNQVCRENDEIDIWLKDVRIEDPDGIIPMVQQGAGILRVNIIVKYSDFMESEHSIEFNGRYMLLNTFESSGIIDENGPLAKWAKQKT